MKKKKIRIHHKFLVLISNLLLFRKIKEIKEKGQWYFHLHFALSDQKNFFPESLGTLEIKQLANKVYFKAIYQIYHHSSAMIFHFLKII